MIELYKNNKTIINMYNNHEECGVELSQLIKRFEEQEINEQETNINKERIERCVTYLKNERPDLKKFITDFNEPTGFLWTTDGRIYELDDIFGEKTDSPTSFCLLLRELQDIFQKEPIKNLCIECGVDMGDCNPRQYCGKTKCVRL